MTLHQPSIRLAGLYLGILMIISLFFSATVYQLSVQEVNRSLQQFSVSTKLPSGMLPDTLLEKLAVARKSQYQEVRSRIIIRLVLTNLVILAGGGVLSYYLARRTLQPIEEAHAAQSRFTADASHELRTPLTTMQSEIEVALMDPTLTLNQAKDRLHSNLEELGKLTALSGGLLRLARLENRELHQEAVEIDGVIQQAIDRVLPAAEAKRILICPPRSTDAVVIGDNDSLTEALVTILDNAVKYSPAKTEVTITADSDNRRGRIIISDQGVGIKASELPHIFERFYRADTARSKQVQGYGLGLAIAKDIITAHHGYLSATSTVGKGTAFTIMLPLA